MIQMTQKNAREEKMQSREYQLLNDDHKKILDHHLADCPVKLGQIAKDLNISIKLSSMDVGISGQIMQENEGYLIRVNRYESRERQRFTIAHEFAHFFLHKPIIDSLPYGIRDNVLYRSGESERIEYEANRLAADIIMPMHLVKKILKEQFENNIDNATIESMAAQFQVSKIAMEIRLLAIPKARRKVHESRI